MSADHHGRSYAAGLGPEPSRDPLCGSASSPICRCASAINVELCSEDEWPGAPRPGERGPSLEVAPDEAESGERRAAVYGPASAGAVRLPGGKLQCEVCGMICIGPNVLMVHKRSHTGERPFQCSQCGASFTQKGNLLRHIKLHSGEKPFKCPVCSYACRRRDALAGHLRTHAVSSLAVGKPFKCSICSRSYKQQGTLEEHQQRCHSCTPKNQKLGDAAPPTQHGCGTAAEEVAAESQSRPAPQPSSSADRLGLSLTKRKRSTPQKFSAEKQMDLDTPEAPYELSSGSEKEPESGDWTGLVARHLPGSRGQLHPTFVSNSSLQGPPHGGLELAEGRDDPSPNGCPDSTDTESAPEEQSTRATVPTSTSNNQHLRLRAPAPSGNHSTSSPLQTKDLDPDWARACPAPAAMVRRTSREAVQVLDADGQALRSFHCRHCRILFLDHVMFTIHMGCHGYRQPFECNICGHRSQDRYQFSSHICRGEHLVG
ncbi:zinc finger protein Eos isoform X2 [Synchiropus splendidus]|uniref:zinc finger protein Eos isoform X2 n=1 Tax=Synchiropus splendidus TaxID=270530 RepID=UPI00237DF39F|nr:zinc finger protein Eos isoform X2 [Synchiropus splendidus]XP_053706533.1 zinc finger protein Eos isoform X2 [Synchiropus splendidus]